MSGEFDGLSRRDARRVHGFLDSVELVRAHPGHALQVGRHVLGSRLPDGEGLRAPDVDGPRARRYPVVPDRHVFFDRDFAVVGVSSVHLRDVFDGVGAGGDACVVGVGGSCGHGRKRGSGARVEGTRGHEGAESVVANAGLAVRALHDDPAADSVAQVEVNEPQVRKEGRGDRGHPGR